MIQKIQLYVIGVLFFIFNYLFAVVQITVNPGIVGIGEVVSFSVPPPPCTLKDPKYIWSCGDGWNTQTTVPYVSRTCNTSGNFWVNVTIFDGDKLINSGSGNVTVVEITGITGPEVALLTQNQNPPPDYLTGDCGYSITTNPPNTPCPSITWTAPSDATVNPSSSNGTLSYTTKFQTGGEKTISVTCGTSSKSITTYVFRPDISVGGANEDTEENPGVYIQAGKETSCSIGIIGALPSNSTLTLSCNKPEKVSLWEGNIQRSFPFTCSINSIPSLKIKGENPSINCKDIILSLTTSKGGSDSAVVTVYSIDVNLAGMNEETEEETGLYLPLNDDDDNSDTTLDYQENPVNGENDLVSVSISAVPSDLPGTFTLSWGSNVKLWDTATKNNLITKTTYTASELPKTYYVEGYNPSSSVKDTEIKLSYTAPDGTIGEDKAKLTIWDLEIDNEILEDSERSDEIQVQRVNTSNFEWEAIPFKIVYDLAPQPQSVKLIIFQGQTIVYQTYLSTSSGQNKVYEWDGKNNEGELVVYGNYKAKIIMKLPGIQFESNEYPFTVYQINQENLVYHEILGGFNEHVGIIGRYEGGNKLSDLNNWNKYWIWEIRGRGWTVGESRTLQDFDNYSDVIGIYTSSYLPTGVIEQRRERKQIIQNARALFGTPYVEEIEIHDVLIPYGSWDGVISDIQRIRCDGVSEVAYENSATRLYCTDTNWNIMLSQENLNYHNGANGCTPERQRTEAGTISSLYLPYP